MAANGAAQAATQPPPTCGAAGRKHGFGGAAQPLATCGAAGRKRESEGAGQPQHTGAGAPVAAAGRRRRSGGTSPLGDGAANHYSPT